MRHWTIKKEADGNYHASFVVGEGAEVSAALRSGSLSDKLPMGPNDSFELHLGAKVLKYVASVNQVLDVR